MPSEYPESQQAPTRAPVTEALGLLLVMIVSAAAMLTAMDRNSLTFDEGVLIAGGARGWETGHFDLAPDHPPLMQYVYGLPAHLADPNLPRESDLDGFRPGGLPDRYRYMRAFFFDSGNPTHRLVRLGRLPAVVIALALIGLTFAIARAGFGPVAGLLAATSVAFMPDVLAHGAIAYSDLPVALGYLLGLHALDRAVRRPGPGTGALAGIACGLAIGVKISAMALLPAAALLLALEAVARGEDRKWRRAVAAAIPAALLASYSVLVLIFRGDWTLEEFRYGFEYRWNHLTAGHGASAFLLGMSSPTGWWYYYPVVLFLKTPAGFHLLAVLAGASLLGSRRTGWRSLAGSRLRAPVVGVAVYGAALVGSSLDIGFRYALPLLPLLAIIVAAGLGRAWSRHGRGVHLAIVGATLALIAHPLSYWPHFLGYVSEYGPGRDRNYRVLGDSSLDWGQGLVELERFMERRGVSCVNLAYFGSAWPSAYGIDHRPLPSFLPLPDTDCGAEPRWTVVSASLLNGRYLAGDPLGRYRGREPDAVIAHAMLAWRDP